MAKHGQHNHDSRDSDKSRGNNNPSQSQTITTGTYKKEETYAERAREHQDPEPVAQQQRNDWNPDTRDKPSLAATAVTRTPIVGARSSRALPRVPSTREQGVTRTGSGARSSSNGAHNKERVTPP
jgi:hypothetical protein